MEEKLLQHIWLYGLYDNREMKTVDGQEIQVISPGFLNTNAGPDFIDARIRIDSTLWAGCIEVHKKSSDWKSHGHAANPAYNNVVLHVVIENDTDIVTSNGVQVPAIELKFHPKIEQNYAELYHSRRWVPCESRFGSVDPLFLTIWVESLSVERLERKSGMIRKMLSETKQDRKSVV